MTLPSRLLSTAVRMRLPARAFSANASAKSTRGGDDSAAGSAPAVASSTEAFVRSLVREQDREAFLSGMFHADHESRSDFFALRAYHVEIARVVSASRKNAAAAAMRLQWWQGLLDEACRDPALEGALEGFPHPAQREPFAGSRVVEALTTAVARRGLSRAWLERPLQARIAAVEAGTTGAPPATMEDAEAYAEQVQASALYSALEVAGVAGDEQAELAASFGGRAQGLLLTLRSAPYYIEAGGTPMLPAEVMRRHGAGGVLGRGDDADRARQRAALASAAEEIAETAGADLQCAYEVCSGEYYERPDVAPPSGKEGLVGDVGIAVDARAVPALLPLLGAQLYLDRLRKAEYDLLHPSLRADRTPLVRLQMKMLWASLRQRLG
jgi:NADH dehydrogenase [ubiquinone] 1 alpha subcomplex assembly factor 6